MNKKEKISLHNMFKDESVLGIKYFQDGGPSGIEYDPDENDLLSEPLELYAYFPEDYGHMGKCTNCAKYIVDKLGDHRSEVYGFYVKNNHVESKDVQGCFGHDFAVVDKRYIVDIWLSVYSGIEKQIVFDLEDPNDAVKIKFFYGDPAKWDYLDNDKGFIRSFEQNFPDEKRLRAIELDQDTSLTI